VQKKSIQKSVHNVIKRTLIYLGAVNLFSKYPVFDTLDAFLELSFNIFSQYLIKKTIQNNDNKRSKRDKDRERLVLYVTK